MSIYRWAKWFGLTIFCLSFAGSALPAAALADVDTTVPTQTLSTQANRTKVLSAPTNTVAAQELNWQIDQPKPTATPMSIPLMLTDPNPGTTNITQAIKQTLATHPDILQKFAEALAAQADIGTAKGGLLPSLDVSGAIGPDHTNAYYTQGDVNLTHKESEALLRQLLFDGGNVTNQIRQARATYEVSAYQLEQAKELLSFNAADAYLNVLRQRQLVEINTYDVRAHQILLGKVARRAQLGAGTRADVELAQGRLAQSQAGLTQSEGNLANANDTYMRIVGVYPTVHLQKPMVPLHLPGSLAQAQQLGMVMSPLIQASLAQIATAQAAAGVARSSFYPTVSVDVDKRVNNDLNGIPGTFNQTQGLVRASYNVFKGGSDASAVSAANYRVTAAVDQSRVTQRDVAFDIAQSWNNLLAELNQIHNLAIHQQQSYDVWQAYIKQFQLGQRTLFDMLNAQSEYYSAKEDVVNATYDAMSSRYQLLADIGALVGTIINSEQNVFTRRPLTPAIPPGEQHATMVPVVGSNVPPPPNRLPYQP